MWKEISIEGDGVLGLECSGKLSEQDFKTMHAWLDRELARAPKKPALVIFMGTFEGYESAAALWADMKVDMRHGNDFSRVALVADQKWIEWSTKATDFVMAPELKWFENAAGCAAIAWARPKG